MTSDASYCTKSWPADQLTTTKLESSEQTKKVWKMNSCYKPLSTGTLYRKLLHPCFATEVFSNNV